MTQEKAISDIQNSLHNINELQKRTFSDSVQLVFNEFPEVDTISWKQFTPYFNDGSPCRFTIDELSFHVREENKTYSRWGYNNEKYIERFKFLNNVFEEIGSFLETKFGEFASVSINRSGEASVEEYNAPY